MIKLSWTVVTGSILFLVAGFFFHHTFADIYSVSIITAGRGPVFFPRILLAVMLALSLGIIWEGRLENRNPISLHQILPSIGAIGLTGFYIFAISAAGFLISTTVFVFILPWLMGYRNIRLIATITVLYPVSAWYMFDRIFKIILPVSPWFDFF